MGRRPANEGAARPARRAATARSRACPLILVCEDDPIVSAYFSDALEAAGYLAVCVPNGEAALRFARHRRPAAILLDLALPGLDGAAVLARLRADQRTAAIPVVIVSAYPGWLTFLDRSQAAAVIEKPCLPEQLETALARVLPGVA